MISRLRVIVRADLSPGQQAVQGMHAQVAFAKKHPESERTWHEQSNTLALLSVPNEDALHRLLQMAEDRGIQAAYFREPDIGDQMTAICLEACEETAGRLCRGLPTALKGL